MEPLQTDGCTPTRATTVDFSSVRTTSGVLGILLVEREVEPGLVMEWGGWEDWETFREHYLGAYSLDAQQRGMEKVGYSSVWNCSHT
jgi:hypothetical protein